MLSRSRLLVSSCFVAPRVSHYTGTPLPRHTRLKTVGTLNETHWQALGAQMTRSTVSHRVEDSELIGHTSSEGRPIALCWPAASDLRAAVSELDRLEARWCRIEPYGPASPKFQATDPIAIVTGIIS